MISKEVSSEEIAEIIGGMVIDATIDRGGLVAHKGRHPTLGKLVAISSAFGFNMVVHSRRGTNEPSPEMLRTLRAYGAGEPSEREAVEVTREGKTCRGRYEVVGGLVFVFYRRKCKSTQLGSTPTKVLARQLLSELVREEVGWH